VPGRPTIAERARSLRREIVQARIRLADERLTRAQQTELWQVVDCGEWCLRMLVDDFARELETIDREIEDALRPTPRGRSPRGRSSD